MKYQKAFALFLAVLLFAGSLGDPIHNVTVYAQEEKKAEENNTMDITAQSAVLIENSSGRILYEKEKDKELIPASITKIMTLLLALILLPMAHPVRIPRSVLVRLHLCWITVLRIVPVLRIRLRL